MRGSFLERSIANLLDVAEHSLYAEGSARRDGWLQRLDARAKVAGLFAVVIAVTVSRSLTVILALFLLALLLIAASRVGAWRLFARVWMMALLFTGAVVLPALVLTPGAAVLTLPFGLAITETGLRAAAYLVGRVEAATTLSLLLVLSTRWAELLRALRSFGVPLVLVVIMAMTYRYIFVLLQTAVDLFEGRRSRRVGELSSGDKRRLATSTAGALLTRSMHLSDEVYLAMQARGFRGEIRQMESPSMRAMDWLALAAFLGVAFVTGMLGR